MSVNPDVSIIVIAYNEARRIDACLGALTAQDYAGNWDILVVSDGSNDATADIARRYGSRVRVLELPTNQGRGSARQAGIDATIAELVAFVDADITTPPDWLSRLVTALGDHAAVSGIAVPDGDIAPLARITGATVRPVPGSMPITGNNMLIRRDILEHHGFDPSSRLGEDFRLAARLLAAGHTLDSVADVHVAHNETKAYRQSLKWLYHSGRDATGLLVEHRRVRLPDLSWAAWLVVTVAGILAALVRRNPLWLTAGAAATTIVALVHGVTRFRPRPVGRFLWALLANVPLIGAYLAGRSVGAARLAGSAYRRHNTTNGEQT